MLGLSIITCIIFALAIMVTFAVLSDIQEKGDPGFKPVFVTAVVWGCWLFCMILVFGPRG